MSYASIYSARSVE